MSEVTEAAIKSAKFYKHVVQSVEKFIQKVSEHCALKTVVQKFTSLK